MTETLARPVAGGLRPWLTPELTGVGRRLADVQGDVDNAVTVNYPP